MKQLSIWLADKQLRYIKEQAILNKVTFDEMLRRIIEQNMHGARAEEIKRLKGDI